MGEDVRRAPVAGGAVQPGGAGEEDLVLVPRASARTATRTGTRFGAVEVGPPVSRLAPPVPGGDPLAEQAPPAPADPPATDGRCPSCAARVRAGQEWCSLCHASLRPEPAAVVPAPARPPARAASPGDDHHDHHDHEDRDDRDDLQLELDLEGPAARDEAPAGPRLDEEEVQRMLRALAATGERAPRGLGSPRAKLLVAAGGGLGLTVLLLGGTTLLGAITG